MKQQFNVQAHKAQLQHYFDGIGFDRWAAIYGDTENLSAIRRSVRDGHARMLAQADAWLSEWGLQPGATILDAGCGTGLASIALAKRGYRVTSIDIAPSMVKHASNHAAAEGVQDQIQFAAGDLEIVTGMYDAVVCFDVLIHYPEPAFAQMCSHLARMARGPLIMTYAPYNRMLAMKHWIGGHFPQSNRRTTIQMVPQQFVKKTLEATGKTLYRSSHISHGFYHVSLVEARPTIVIAPSPK
jgi:magnesium-protoporphyrin O-methyltransferase